MERRTTSRICPLECSWQSSLSCYSKGISYIQQYEQRTVCSFFPFKAYPRNSAAVMKGLLHGVRQHRISTTVHPAQVEDSITQSAERPQIFPREKNMYLLCCFQPVHQDQEVSYLNLTRNTQEHPVFSSEQDSVQGTFPSSLSIFNKSSLVVFQTETCSFWLALSAVTGQEQKLPLRS